MNEEELYQNLRDFDEEAALLFDAEGIRFSVVIVGGSSLVLLGYSLRVTHDIDVLDTPAQLVPLFAKYGMNARVAAYIDSFPYGFESRLKRLPLSGRIVDFYTPSLEDIVVSKLYAQRPPDLADIQSSDVLTSLDWERLEQLVYGKDEALASALNARRYQEMVDAFERYKEEFGSCGN